LLTAEEMAHFDYLAARGEARTPQFSGDATRAFLPFYLATGTRASLTTRIR
jgi:hypothetical protein